MRRLIKENIHKETINRYNWIKFNPKSLNHKSQYLINIQLWQYFAAGEKNKSAYHPWNSALMVVWIRSSVSRSTAAVASSKTRTWSLSIIFVHESSQRCICFICCASVVGMVSPTLVFLRRALARQISCLWPTLRFSPPSDTSCWNIFGGRTQFTERPRENYAGID